MKLKVITIIGPDERSIGGVSEVNRQILESEALKTRYSIRIIRTWNGTSMIKSYFRAMLQFIKYYKTTDLFHIDLSSNGSFYRKFLFMFTIGKKKKYIIHLHGGGFFDFFLNANAITKKMILYAFNKAETICCVSDSARKQVIDVIGISQEKVLFLYNGVDVIDRNPPEKENPIKILYLGGLTAFRGIVHYLNIADNYKSDDKVVFYVAGTGDSRKLIGHNVKYLGTIEGNTKEDILNSTDIMINYCKNESFGIGMIEGMNHYNAIIGFNGGSIPELLGYGTYGDVIQTEKEAISLIDKYIRNISMLRKRQMSSYVRSNEFTINRFEEGLLKIYSELLPG